MSERRVPIQSYQLDYLCNVCATPMTATKQKLLARYLGEAGDGTRYMHVCPHCAAELWLASEYPRIVHEPVLELS